MYGNIKVTNGENGTVITETSFEFENDEERAGPVSNAGFYTYVVDWLFRTGHIQDYVQEAGDELRAFEAQENAAQEVDE
jgi:hypothetical protein